MVKLETPGQRVGGRGPRARHCESPLTQLEYTLQPPPDHDDRTRRKGLWSRWHNWPLYLRIVGGVVLGVTVGVILGERAEPLQIPSKLVLRVLGALAPPLVLLAIVQALMRAEVVGRKAAHLAGLLVLNTVVAISIGLLVANVIQPGRWVKPQPPEVVEHTDQAPARWLSFSKTCPAACSARFRTTAASCR